MSEHDAVKSLLAGFSSGSLTPEERELVRRHLGVCENCSRDAASLQQLVHAFQRLPAPAVSPVCLVRIATLATARRMEVIERRKQTCLIIAAALLGWTLVIVSLPIWQWLAESVRAWSGWQMAVGFPTAFALSALFSYLFLPALWPLLERHSAIPHEEESQ